MSFNVSTYKLIKSLSPFEVYDIVTKGLCPEESQKGQEQIRKLYNHHYLTHWMEGTKTDLLDMYISDSGFQILTTKERAQRLEKEFKSWGLFYEVWSKWYGGELYQVGFNYDYNAFEILYKEYHRDRKLKELL